MKNKKAGTIPTPEHITFQNQQNPSAEFDMIRYEEALIRPDVIVDALHIVEFYILILIESGRGEHTIDFTGFSCQKGTLLCIRKDQLHKFHSGNNLHGTMLLFTDDFLVSYLEQLESQKALQLFNELLGSPKVQLSQESYLLVSALVSRLRSEYFEVNDSYSMGIIRSELHILINQLFRIKSQKEQILPARKYLGEFIQFQRLVEENVHKTNKVQDYAHILGLSTKTLNTISKSIISKTAKEFIDEICIVQIKRLLINTELSVKEIAYASGFEETTNFYKYFKRHTELTPEQFRISF